MDTNVVTRAVAWAQVEKTWNAGKSSCLTCPHRAELRAPAGEGAPISIQCCALLVDPSRHDVTDCPGFGVIDPIDMLEERARRGFCVALAPRPRDLFDQPAPILIGSAYRRPMGDQGPSADRLQDALLEPRTARRAKSLAVAAAALFWNKFC